MTKVYKVFVGGRARDLFNELEEKCKAHDWWFSMSDDHRFWVRGNEQRKEINKLVRRLRDIGLGKEADEIYYKYAPEEFLPKEAAHDGQGEEA